MTTGSAVEKRQERGVSRHEPTRRGPYFRPVVDIVETGEEIRVLADMPGVKSENIDVNFEKGVLTIHGKVEARQPQDTTAYLLREYGVGDFYRVFEVSETIDADRISAEYNEGVLVLHLPKAEKARARKIEVRAR